MSKQLESALEAVARMSPGSEIDPVVWLLFVKEVFAQFDQGHLGNIDDAN